MTTPEDIKATAHSSKTYCKQEMKSNGHFSTVIGVLCLIFVLSVRVPGVHTQQGPDVTHQESENGITCTSHNGTRLSCVAQNFISLNLTVFPPLILKALSEWADEGFWKEVAIIIPNLPDIPAGTFNGNIPIEILRLSSLASGEIPDDAFDGLAHDLSHLELLGNDFQKVPSSSLDKLYNLTVLDLSENSLTEIWTTDFNHSSLQNLQYLDLGYNQISSIAPGAFRELKSLIELNIDHNELESIDGDMFEGLAELKNLFLQGNSIQIVKNDLLLHLQALEYLNLDSNQISSFQDIRHISSQKLSFFSIEKNHIEGNLDADMFHGLSNLTSLLLKGNKIDHISQCSLAKLTNLELLDLDGNQITELGVAALACIPSLKHLSLSFNKITFVDGTSLHNLTNLENLNLTGNQLQSLSCENTADLLNLITVDLSKNSLEVLHPGVFGHSQKLNNVLLKDNKLVCNCTMRGFSDYAKLSTFSLDSAECSSPPELQGLNITDFSFSQLGCNEANTTCKSPALERLNKFLTTVTEATTSTISPTNVANVSDPSTENSTFVTTILPQDDQTTIQVSNQGTSEVTPLVLKTTMTTTENSLLSTTGLQLLTTTLKEFETIQTSTREISDEITTLIPPSTSPTPSVTETTQVINGSQSTDSTTTVVSTNATTTWMPSISMQLNHSLTTVVMDNETSETSTQADILGSGTDVNLTSTETTTDEGLGNATLVSTMEVSTSVPSFDPALAGHDFGIRIKLFEISSSDLYVQWHVKNSMSPSECQLKLHVDPEIFGLTNFNQFNCSDNFYTLRNLSSKESYTICLTPEYQPTGDPLTKPHCVQGPKTPDPKDITEPDDVAILCPDKEVDGIFCICSDSMLKCIGRGNASDTFPDVMYRTLQTNNTWVKIEISIPLRSLSGNIFDNVPAVKSLSITSSGIINLSNDTLTALKSTLGYLSLKSNNFTKIPSNAINNLVKLETLDMSANRINAITTDDLKGLENLRILDLSYNLIAQIEPGSFKELKKLVELNLLHNKISEISEYTFQGLNKMEELYLSHNQIQFVAMNEYLQISSLQRLDLAHNHISSLLHLKLAMGSLKYLILNNNKITGAIGSSVLVGVPSLRFLTMGNNSINEIQSCTLAKLTLLEFLLLNQNQIHHLPSSSWACLGSLAILNLNDNQITSIDDNAFANLTKLEKLDLDQNNITYLKCEHTKDLEQLESISLRNNPIRSIGPGVFQNSHHLKQVKIEANQLQCDCELWDYATLVRSKPTLVEGNLTCSGPDALKGKSITDVDFPSLGCSERKKGCTAHDTGPTPFSPTVEVLLNRSELRNDSKLYVEWDITISNPHPKGQYGCNFTYVTLAGTEIQSKVKNCQTLRIPGRYNMSFIVNLPPNRKKNEAIKEVCLAISLNNTVIEKRCSADVPDEQGSYGKELLPTSEAPEITSIFLETELPDDDDNATQLRNITIDTLLSIGKSIMVEWSLQKEAPRSICKLRLVLYYKDVPVHEEAFRCSNGSHTFEKLKRFGKYKVCIAPMHIKKGWHSTCSNVHVVKPLPAVIGAARAELSGHRSSALPLPMLILIFILGVLLIVIVIILVRMNHKKNRQEVSTIQLRSRNSFRARLFSRSSGSYDLAEAQKGAYWQVQRETSHTETNEMHQVV